MNKTIEYCTLFNRIAGNVGIIKLLIENGADVNASKSIDAWTSLHMAASTGKVEVAKVLIENCADLNAKDFHGKTPLFLAVYNRGN